jgi:hypothetical protein
MQVVASNAQPTLSLEVTTPDHGTRRMTVFTGTVDVAPPDAGRRFRALASDPNGVPVGFYVAEPFALPIAGAVLVAEAWIARMPISTGADDTVRYGLVDATGALVAGDTDPERGWPFISGVLFGGDLTMTIAYRLTAVTS